MSKAETMTDLQIIIDYLLNHRYMTALDCTRESFMQEYGTAITCLPTRISELRRKGYDIDDEWVDLPNKKHAYKQYWINRPDCGTCFYYFRCPHKRKLNCNEWSPA